MTFLRILPLALLALACHGVNASTDTSYPDDNGPPGEGHGFIQVALSTTNPVSGAAYTVAISNGQKRTAAPNATLNFTTSRTGTHEIALSSVPAACTLAGDNPAIVDIHPFEHVNVSFSITCPAT